MHLDPVVTNIFENIDLKMFPVPVTFSNTFN